MFAFVKAFIAGFLAVLSFHQGLVWLLDMQGVIDATPWAMTPVPPLGVPKVVSSALFGGLWGVLLWLLIRRALAAGYYVGAIILGAIFPSLVALTLVTWLKNGQDTGAMIDSWNMHRMWIALAVNGAWGLGVAVFMRIMHPPR
ncbi:hypothetical protein [Salinisphaera sp. T31B1]|uniref:hypothetical protein n=1 Tax=Salinisphaera sp. T31B1 TaxID=727963 RepID=UPI00333F6578